MTDAPAGISDQQVKSDMNASLATSYSYMYCGESGLAPFEVKDGEEE